LGFLLLSCSNNRLSSDPLKVARSGPSSALQRTFHSSGSFFSPFPFLGPQFAGFLLGMPFVLILSCTSVIAQISPRRAFEPCRTKCSPLFPCMIYVHRSPLWSVSKTFLAPGRPFLIFLLWSLLKLLYEPTRRSSFVPACVRFTWFRPLPFRQCWFASFFRFFFLQELLSYP